MAAMPRLALRSTAFFLCDVQSKFRAGVHHFEQIVDVAQRMVAASTILKVPLIATEQYPQGLGKLVEELRVPADVPVVAKTTFSMLVPEVVAQMRQHEAAREARIRSVVLFGIEAHACVQATTLDLRQEGYDVHVLVDGVSSRSPLDRSVALERMRDAGAVLTTTESVLLELLRDAKHPSFKEVQKLIMKPTPILS